MEHGIKKCQRETNVMKFKTSVLKMEAVGDLRSSLHASWRQKEHITSDHLPFWRQKQQVTQEKSLLTPWKWMQQVSQVHFFYSEEGRSRFLC